MFGAKSYEKQMWQCGNVKMRGKCGNVEMWKCGNEVLCNLNNLCGSISNFNLQSASFPHFHIFTFAFSH